MGIYDALFSAIFNVFSIYINVRILKLFLPVKIAKATITMPIYIGMWFINWFVYYYFNIPNLTTISLLIGLMVTAIVIFNGSIWKKIMAVIISNASGIIAENIVWKLSTMLMMPIESEAVGGLCSVILKFLIILFIERCISLDRCVQLPKAGYFNIILIAIGSVVLAEMIMLYNTSNDSTLICLSIICLINVNTYYIYEKISDSWKDKLMNAEMEQQIRIYENQFDIIEQTQQNIRSLKHDMKNHISLLRIFLKDKEYEKAIEYVDILGEGLKNEREYVKTGNIEVDSILNYKLEYIEKKLGCGLDIQVSVPEQSFMSGFDLNVLLGNLLDNAIDAIKKAEEKYLSIIIRYTHGVLYISVYNTFDGKIKKKGGRLLTRKKDKNNHGVGLENVNRIIEKFGGTMKIEYDKLLFKIDIILFLETAKI